MKVRYTHVVFVVALVGAVALYLALSVPPSDAQRATLVSSFENQGDLAKWHIEADSELVTEHATDGQRSLHLRFPEGKGLIEAQGTLPSDWSAWKLLKFDAFNPGPQFSVTVRVDDTDGKPISQWYMPLRTGQSTQDVVIPCLAEGINVKSVARLQIRVDPSVERPVEFYLDNLRFTPTEDMATYVPPNLPQARPPLAEEESLIDNPDFEFGLQGWGSWGQWDGGQYVFSSGTGDNAYSGRRSAAVICNKVGRGGIWSPPVAVPQEADYKLTFWAKASEPSAIRFGMEGGGVERLSPRTDIGTDWAEQTFTLTLPAGIQIHAYLYSVGPGTVYFDRVKLEREGEVVSIPKPQYAAMTPSKLECRGDVTLLNGKPWYAVGIYHGVPGELQGTGFNCIPGWDEGVTLEDCLKAGILKLPDLTGLMRAHVPESAGDRIHSVKNHPAIGAWYVCDEPDHAQWNVAPDELKYATSVLHKEDPNHPTLCVVMAWAESNIYRYWDSVDILASDDYPIGERKPSDLLHVARTTDLLRRATHGAKPVWLVIQSTSQATPEEEYAVTYLCVTHGANGILYWEYQDAKKSPAVWQAMVALANELRDLTPALTSPTAEPGATADSDRLHLITKKAADGLYVIAVNAAPEPVGRATISVPGAKDGTVEVLFEGRQLKLAGSKITDEFRGYERHAYKLQK